MTLHVSFLAEWQGRSSFLGLSVTYIRKYFLPTNKCIFQLIFETLIFQNLLAYHKLLMYRENLEVNKMRQK